MANKLLHTKQKKSEVSNHFYASNTGNDTDINIVSMASKGNYLTAKAGGQWHSVKLQPPQEVDNGNFIDLTVTGDAVFQKGKVLFQKGWTSLGDVYLRGSQKLYFETGSSADTYIVAGADTLEFHIGGDNIMTLNETDTGFWLELQNNADLVISGGDKLWLDGAEDGNTYIIGERSLGDTLEMFVGGNAVIALTSSNLSIAGTTSLTSTTADQFKIKYDASNYALMNVSATGDLEIETIGAGTTDSDITLNADGDILMDAAGGDITITSADLSIAATKKLYFDGGTETYIYEASADVARHVVGNDILLQLSEKGDDGNEVSFGSSCAGFTQIEPTYNASNTVVDFRHSNKQFVTFGAGNITNLASYFPLVSGNFVLLLKQDGTGSRTVTNWKVFEFDESSADGSAAVVWAGGSAPTLTTDANHVDILSFYWDADNEIAYGVATLDFQF